MAEQNGRMNPGNTPDLTELEFQKFIAGKTKLRYSEVEFAVRFREIFALLRHYRSKCMNQRRELRRLNRAQEAGVRAIRQLHERIIKNLVALPDATKPQELPAPEGVSSQPEPRPPSADSPSDGLTIGDLKLSMRVRNILRANCRTPLNETPIGSLTAFSQGQLMALPGVGKTAVAEIRTALRMHGLDLSRENTSDV